MSLLVYFDTNVFDNVVKKTGGVTGADEEWLRAASSSGKLTIVASHINIRETLAAFVSRPDIARTQFSLIASLADWERLIRFSTQILEDDIRHFAFNGERANSPFESDRQASHIRSVLQTLLMDWSAPKQLGAVIGEDRDQKRAFLEGVKKSRAETARELEEFRK